MIHQSLKNVNKSLALFPILIAKFKFCVFYLKLAEISPRATDVISIKFGSMCSEVSDLQWQMLWRRTVKLPHALRNVAITSYLGNRLDVIEPFQNHFKDRLGKVP